ncbi:hypothetical protein NITHO_2380005 [Nitrolancea hollandica Lb]|uniref:Uncharacterized protein n=1 Tax=Nitrolancea hollandica Lb TaxID=1129897 RepID=I4EFR4_9BACT|nr:hypothetical protein NITHO_2380005 [Nitrolancea hollandica Lb]
MMGWVRRYPAGSVSPDAVFDTDQRIINSPVQLIPEDTAPKLVPILLRTLGIDFAGEFVEAGVKGLERGDDGSRISTLERVGEVQPLIQEMIEELARFCFGFARWSGTIGHDWFPSRSPRERIVPTRPARAPLGGNFADAVRGTPILTPSRLIEKAR